MMLARTAMKVAGGILVAASMATAETDLDKNFASPPDSSRPWTFWFWVNGNVTKEGIKADLEDMKRVGIGGAMLFDGKMYLPGGPVRYGSDVWHDHVQYAFALADELGLQLGVMNCAGWATAGGPWISLEQSMKMLVWSEQPVEGGRPWAGRLPQPPMRENFYRDVAVMAVPERDSAVTLTAESPAAVVLDFGQPTEADTLILPGCEMETLTTGKLESSENGKIFHQVALFEESSKDWPMAIPVKFPLTKARYFRVTITKNPGSVKAADTRIVRGSRLTKLPQKIGTRTAILDEQSEGDGIPANQIVDLTSRMKPDGTLDWDVPAGRWTILRFGYTTTAQTNHPAVPEGTGWEVDKFDPVAVAYHFEKGLGRLIREAGPHLGRSFTGVVSDSWEAGPQTWTAAMPKLFEEHRGYAMGSYLACLAGRVVESHAKSEAFLRDYRHTLGDLYADNYYGVMRRLANEHGLKFMAEGYGGVMDEFKVNAELDLPAVEFWNHNLYKSCGVVPSVAHTTGKPIVIAEAFTSRPPDKSGWREIPAMLKTLGDEAYALGINRFALHSYVHQPRSDITAGFTHGRYGTQFGRLNSWWPLAGGWIDYLKRCQFLLQHGQPVIDLLYLEPEKLATEARDLNFPWSGGRRGDFLSTGQLKDTNVEEGLLGVKSDLRYRALVLPERCLISLDGLKSLNRLKASGARILGSMQALPAGLRDLDNPEWQEEAAPWKSNGAIDFDFAPDFQGDQVLRFFHRRDQGVDLYFVANTSAQRLQTSPEFRVTGFEPEIWNPITGKILPAGAYEIRETGTRVALDLEPEGSVFVVFRHPSKRTKNAAVPESPAEVVDVGGPWSVAFQAQRGAPASITLPTLQSLSKQEQPGVRYFSGVATYTKDIELPAGATKVRLDLGQVCDLAEITVNGKPAGIVWKAPFIVDISSLVQPGKNTLAIAVANRWVNRLIGDETLPPDAEYNDREPNRGALREFPAWWNQPDAAAHRLRVTFPLWKHYSGKEPLVDSGLIGPVRLLLNP